MQHIKLVYIYFEDQKLSTGTRIIV